MYTVLDENLQVKGRLSLNNGQGNTTFFSDTITIQMATDNANDPAGLTTVDYTNQDKQGNAKQWSHTLTISVEATDLGTSINTTNYLMYFDSVADHYYLMKVINAGTDRNSGFITVSAINAAIFELGKQLIQAEQTLAQVDLKTFVSKMYKNAPFSLRVADDNLTVIDYVVSANTSLQALLQDLQTKYDVDVDSWVELDTTGRIVDRVLYFGHLGSDNGELIRYGGAKGFENMTATEVSDIIYTKLYVTGKTDDKDATKGHIGTVNNGLEYITDDDANQLMYAIGASQQQPVYLEGTITNSLLSEPKALLEWAKQQIGIFNHPRFNYTVSPLHDQIVALGDTVTVQDFHIKPEILVTSKVIQKTVSFASPETNTFVLGEFSSIFTDNMNKSANVINLIKKDVTVTQEAAQQAADKAELARQQADAAHNEAVKAQADAYNAQVSADGKAVILTVTSLDQLPQTAKEGTQAWYDAANGTYLYVFLDGKWVKRIDPDMATNIENGVNQAINQAKDYSDKAIADNQVKVDASIKSVDDKANQLKQDQSALDTKAQGYANQAKADAIADANGNFQSQKTEIDNISSVIGQTNKNIDSVTVRVQTAEGNIDTAQNNITGLQSSQKQTADGLLQEVSDRKSGDSTVLQQGKDYTASQVSNSETNMKSLINQKADSATVGVIQNDVTTLKANTQWQRIERFDDMNFMTQSGRFFIGASNNTNSAVTASLYMMVDAPQTDRITQTQWKDLDGSLMYRRTYNGSSWTPWAQMVMSSTLLNIFHDSWSLGTSTNDGITKQLITGINGQADGTLVLSGKSIVLNSQTIKGNDFIIGSANIANGAIGTAQIGDAAITSAKIASLDARKITTGQLSGPSLNIDLDQGNVFFQKGRIYDSKTQIDVNIDQAYIRTTNGGGSATLQNGRLLLTGPVYNNGQTIDSNPYFSVSASLLPTFSNQPDGAVGSLLESKDFSEISVNGHGNIGFLANMAAERGAGIGISAVTGTYIAGNDQGVILSGGKDIGGVVTAESPNFVVGYDDSKSVDGKDVGGNSILARANKFVVAANNYSVDKYGNMSVPKLQNSANITFESTNQSIVFRTGNDYRLQIRENGYIYLWNKKYGSGGSSLQVAGDGALFVQSSATKYKEDIQYDGGTSVGDKFLTLDPATWQDKDEYEQRKTYREKGIEPDHNIHLTDKRYYGLIAEDLVKAGLEEFVVRDEVTGEVNGLEYDKVAISLIPVVREQRDAINELRLEVERLKQK